MLSFLQHFIMQNVELFATFSVLSLAIYPIIAYLLDGFILTPIKIIFNDGIFTMDRLVRFKIKSLKQLYLLFFIISLVIALMVSLIILNLTTPYNLHLIDKISIKNEGFVLYHDFNLDGFSEKVQIVNKKNKNEYYLLFSPYSQDIDNKVIDQFTFQEPLNPKWIFFSKGWA